MKKKLGEILVTSGAVTSGDVDAALAEQSAGEPSRLGDLLVATGKLSASQLAQGLAQQYQLPYVELPPLPQAVLDLVPMDLQREYRFVPLKSDGTELHVAMADLANLEVVARLEQQWTKVHVSVASGDEIDALHATLSGLFALPSDAAVPSAGGSPTADELFGSLDLGPDPEPAPPPLVEPLPEGVPSVSPSQVMRIASAVSHSPPPVPSPVPAVAPLLAPSPVPHIAPVGEPVVTTLATPGPHGGHAPSAHLAEDLFGDLNLESVRTGIPAKPPVELVPDPVPPPPPSAPEPPAAIVEPPPAPPPVMEDADLPPLVEGTITGPVVVAVSESAIQAPIEGTGPLIDMLLKEGTGPVVDTPFFQDALGGPLVPTLSDAPFVSSRSSISAPALQPAPPPVEEAAVPPAGEGSLPDWLKDDAAAAPAPTEAPAPSATGAPHPPQPWTGALDHLMPSKLVVGLTRALLARGLVSEDEILAALGQKKK